MFRERESLERKIESFLNTCLKVENRADSPPHFAVDRGLSCSSYCPVGDAYIRIKLTISVSLLIKFSHKTAIMAALKVPTLYI
jgi:hypothetical protein